MIIDMLFLFAIHCLADFPLQGEYLEKNKRKSLYLLTCHCILYAFIVWVGFCIITGARFADYFSNNSYISYTNRFWKMLCYELFDYRETKWDD